MDLKTIAEHGSKIIARENIQLYSADWQFGKVFRGLFAVQGSRDDVQVEKFRRVSLSNGLLLMSCNENLRVPALACSG